MKQIGYGRGKSNKNGNFAGVELAVFPAWRLICALRGTHLLLLRAFPGIPRLALDAVELLDLQVTCGVEVTNGRLPPCGLNMAEILTDGRLLDLQVLGNRAL